jgi:RNA polymerase sigma-70 factor (ECF subfamily)
VADPRAPAGRDRGALHTADLYLACACAGGDAAGLAAFEARYIAEVPVFLAGVERGAAAVEEVSQLVRERLFVAGAGRRPKILESDDAPAALRGRLRRASSAPRVGVPPPPDGWAPT